MVRSDVVLLVQDADRYDGCACDGAFGLGFAAYGPGIVDTPMWNHIDRELAKIVRVFSEICPYERLTVAAGGNQRRRGEGEAGQARDPARAHSGARGCRKAGVVPGIGRGGVYHRADHQDVRWCLAIDVAHDRGGNVLRMRNVLCACLGQDVCMYTS